MAAASTSSGPSFLNTTDEQFSAKIKERAKFKSRSHATYYITHLPELNHRVSLNLDIESTIVAQESAPDNSLDTSRPDLFNMSKIKAVYLGNSMLERLKTTGKDTRLANLDRSWNAGCGGDTTENILYRLSEGMYDILRQPSVNKDIKVWLLVSGTNNLRSKKAFRERDVESWRLLVETCLRMALQSIVLAVGMFYRKDVLDGVVDQSNDMLEQVVEEVNEVLMQSSEGPRVKWIEATNGKVTKDMLDDHVHLNEKGYQIFDETLYPLVQEALERPEKSDE